MPSVQSLLKQQYYGNPRNHFWQIIYALFDQQSDEAYSDKIAFALRTGIALWDVLESCEREGSLDIDIKEPIPNPIQEFLSTEDHQIRYLFFNGSAAERLFEKQIRLEGLASRYTLCRLPSSSPAMTATFATKLEAWQAVKEALIRG
jgi:TDG/mug DNA glycosylase family protein